MNERFFYFSLTALFLISFVYAADTSGVPGLEGVESDSVVKSVQDLQGFVEERKWEYLGKEWQNLLLKNSFVMTLDGAFKKLNFLFFFLLGENYSLSLRLFFIFLFWIFFLSMYERILSNFSPLSKGVSFIVAFILVIIMAHLKALNFFAVLLFKVIFYKQGWWSWISVIIFLLVFVTVLVYLEKIIWIIGRKLKKTQEEREKWDAKFERQIIKVRMKGIEEGFRDIT